MKTILNVFATLMLVLLVVTETFTLFRMLTGSPIQEKIDEAQDNWEADDLSVWDPVEGPEVVYDSGVGDVVKYNNQKFRVNGSLMSTDTIDSGYADYMIEDGSIHKITMQTCYGVDTLLEYLDLYFEGDYEMLVTMLPVNTTEENLEYYKQETSDGSIAMIYNDGDYKYYMFVPVTDVYLLITADDIVYWTDSAETVVFGDPSQDPMYNHTFNSYELGAIENTRNKLTDGTYENNDNITTQVTGTAETYTSSADNEMRKQMLNYGNYQWKPDGTSDSTGMTIDLTSTTAKASEWVLEGSTPYAFTDNALKLHTLKATKSADSFNLTGKITNQIAASRPYVIVIKFLNNDKELLGLRVIDKRNEPIPANDVADWSYVLNLDGGIDIAEIRALQFEIY